MSGKLESLWEQQIHAYYLIDQNIMEAQVNSNTSQIIKAILNHRGVMQQNTVWDDMMQGSKFRMKKMYLALQNHPEVTWKTLFYGNLVRPRAMLNLWIACNERLATRTRLFKYGLIDTAKCYFCNEEETQQHLLFECLKTKGIWMKVLDRLQIKHTQIWVVARD